MAPGRLLGAILLLAAAAGCKGAKPAGPAATSTDMPIRLFAETAPIAALAWAQPYLWAGSDRGLRRWNLSEAEGDATDERMDRVLGLSGKTVRALGVDADGALWVATDGGVGRVDGDRYRQAAPSPGNVARLMPPEHWEAGTRPTGVLIVLEDGSAQRFDGHRWAPVPELAGAKVTAVVRDLDGSSMWFGTAGRGLLRAGKDGAPRPVSELSVLECKEISSIAAVGPAAIAATCRAGSDGDRLILTHPAAPPEELRVSPELPLQAVVQTPRGTLVLAGAPGAERFYSFEGIERGTPAPEGGFRLLPVRKGTEAQRYGASLSKLRVPPEPTAHVVAGKHIYFGTRSLGVARAADHAPRFLRGGDILDEADRLSIACAADGTGSRCFVATGGHRFWRFDGSKLSEEDAGQGSNPEVKVLLLTRDSAGAVLAIMRDPAFMGFVITRLEADGWKLFRRLEVEIPEGVPAVSFATASPSGSLWLGLRHRLKDGLEVGDGALELVSMSGRALVHRRPPAGELPRPEQVPVPLDLRAAILGPDAMWFAGGDGVWRWQGGQMRRWGENDGMESEVCHSLLRGPGERLWVGTSAGVLVLDGERFRPRGGLTDSFTRALVRDSRGRVWAGTQKGLVMISEQDGREIEQRWNAQNGLADDGVLALATDPFGRVWALGTSAIAVVGP